MKNIMRKKYKIETNNASYGIFCGAILFSVGYLISGIQNSFLFLPNLLKVFMEED